MSSVAKTAASKINWSTIIPQLGLAGKTATSLAAFKKRNDEAKSVLYELKHSPTTVDFEFYKGKLHNSQIVSKIESDVDKFSASKPDLSKQLNLISTFEAKAVENAKETESLVLKELTNLERTLENIETARPFEELTVEDVVQARPDVEDKVQSMLDKGKFEVPGYKERFGSMVIM
ncbi:ATP synthase d subunit [Brettanomyces nanus]|uniref:ATP synthase subunit d, mitochondrial n=1 Tax=Eeniella nana TaxID=13502 RepID=A0A875S1Z8_EENNA|nr:ATP synthase d subunit [Brettanomyces nanus]QPG75751.1 ATP synthase d subunit [Brettanomyces nanus]